MIDQAQMAAEMAAPRAPIDELSASRFESTPTRSSKGRRSFKVTRRHARRMVGQDPVRAWIADAADVETLGSIIDAADVLRMDGSTLVALADRFVALTAPWMVDPDAHGMCVCTDLTHRVVALDPWVLDGKDASGVATYRRVTPEPVYRPETGSYDTIEVPVRACHCQAFPKLTGTDLGLSYSEMLPGRGEHGSDYLAGYVRKPVDPHAARTRKAHAKRTASTRWDAETAVIADALTSPEPVVQVTSFPGVTISIRRPASGGPMTVRMIRGDETTTFRARTASAIARRVTA